MKKIISLFQRNYDGDRLVRDEITPGAEWVAAGEGVATQKFDGTCCLVRDGKLYRRYDAKKGKTPPQGFEPAQEPDPVTGHYPGWIPVGDDAGDQWHIEAFGLGAAFSGVRAGRYAETVPITEGTYELIGPKVNGNQEQVTRHVLIRHGQRELFDAPRTFYALKAYLQPGNIEGIVWHHPDGRMVKIKTKDFGIVRQAQVAV